MQYEQNRVPSLMDSTANDHLHALLPCHDLPKTLCCPFDLSKALHCHDLPQTLCCPLTSQKHYTKGVIFLHQNC